MTKMTASFLSFFLCAPLARALPPIPNGVETAPGEFPEVVKLFVTTIKGYEICSGTAVGPNTVLTAAHCLTGAAPQGMVIAAASALDPKNPDLIKGTFGVNIYRVDEILIDPQYEDLDQGNDSSWTAEKHDLGLVKIQSPERFKSWIPIETRADDSSFANLPVTLVGYGPGSVVYPGTESLKRDGRNQIAGVWQGLFFFLGRLYPAAYKRPDGQEAGALPGDSGGAVISQGIVGVLAALSPMQDGIEAALQGTFGNQQGETLYQKAVKGWPRYQFVLSVSLSDQENVLFLKDAQAQGYDIRWAGTPPSPAAGTGTLPQKDLPPKSKTLERLKRGPTW